MLTRMRDRGSLLVAFSGGVDSAVVARAAVESLGDRAVALTAASETITPAEVAAARHTASEIGIRHIVRRHSELADRRWRANTQERCYYCKKGLAGLLLKEAERLSIGTVADGVNLSDAGDYRPGIRAATASGIWHPLADCEMDKEDVRAVARRFGLSVAEKPASPCLASRIQYGEAISEPKLRMVAGAERLLHGMGFDVVRVRKHGPVARIEVPPADIPRLARRGGRVAAALKRLGFTYITMDLRGFRSGSMNEVLKR